MVLLPLGGRLGGAEFHVRSLGRTGRDLHRLAVHQHGPVVPGLAGLKAQDDQMAGETDAAEHWDAAYAPGDATLSWYQLQPGMSLRMLDVAGVSADDSVIDVGGGASPLAGALLGRGFTDITVLDISPKLVV